MSIPFCLTYRITPAGWQRIRSKLAANGVEVADACAGTLSAHGVTADFAQDGTRLTVYVKGKPFFLSCAKVEQILTEQINEALA